MAELQTPAPTGVLEAAQRLAGKVDHTPLLEGPLEDGILCKCEAFQPTGSFKIRGALNALLQLDRSVPGVITASSGNHGQAVAYGARMLGIRARVVIPAGATAAKVDAIRAHGAEVRQEGVTFDNRMQVAAEEALSSGFTFVHPYDDWNVILGQGTAALEALQDGPGVRTLVAPVGGGGLLSGTVLAARLFGVRAVVGVEPQVADDAALSLAGRRLVRLSTSPPTMADGVRSLALGERPFRVLVEEGGASQIVTVTEEEIARATVFAWMGLKIALEPSGALPLAAYLAGRLDHLTRPMVLILSGGNFDAGTIAELLRTE